jgi:hypothetical protein
VWKLDRLARSVKQLIETVEKLRTRGIGFRSLTEAIDTTTAQGRLVFHMFSALAEFERRLSISGRKASNLLDALIVEGHKPAQGRLTKAMSVYVRLFKLTPSGSRPSTRFKLSSLSQADRSRYPCWEL